MNILNVFSIIGLSMNLIGSIILAFSLREALSSIKLVLKGHDATLTTLGNPRGLVVFNGLTVHLDRGLKRSNNVTTFGIIMLCLGFALQLIILFLNFAGSSV